MWEMYKYYNKISKALFGIIADIDPTHLKL